MGTLRIVRHFVLIALLSGCRGPLSTLAPVGPEAERIAALWWIMLWGALAISVLMLVLFLIGFRDRQQVVSERVWAGWLGVGFTLSVLTALVTWGLIVGEQQTVRGENSLRVQASARQWYWEFTQPGPDGSSIITRNRLYIPVGQPVIVEITTEDVIHSFWVPRLAGKMDAIPGHTNLLRLIADTPGVYSGVCAEFYGRGHSTMRFTVEAYVGNAFPSIAAHFHP